ncbi:MAG: response regulator [Chloroflexota bacterium]
MKEAVDPRSILVVDDDPYLLSLIAEVLESDGYAVRVANNGAEALKIANALEPRLVLLDVHMPVLDGWGFVKAMRKTGITFPIVIMTGSIDAARWTSALRADDYLGKPFQMDELLAVVERFCS